MSDALPRAERSGEGSLNDQVIRRLVIARSGQYVFKDIVEHYLKQISFADDKFASMIRLPQYGDANVVLDPHRGYGQPVLDASGARVADVLGPLRAGATFHAVADDYGLTEAQLLDRDMPPPQWADAGIYLHPSAQYYFQTSGVLLASRS